MTGLCLRAWSSDISRGMGVTAEESLVDRRRATARVRLVALADPDLVESLSRLGGTQAVRSSVTAAEVTASFSAEAEQSGCRFQIVRLHDQGGLGSVFVARDQELHREVALKQMKEEIATDKASPAGFVFEAEITGNLEHPGVIPVYGKGEYDDGRPVLRHAVHSWRQSQRRRRPAVPLEPFGRRQRLAAANFKRFSGGFSLCARPWLTSTAGA